MANVKRVYIQGTLPFDLGQDDEKAHDALVKLLAITLQPCIGLRLRYSASPCGSKPSRHGGKIAMYGFELEGHEALSYQYFDSLRPAVVAVGGTIKTWEVTDIEG